MQMDTTPVKVSQKVLDGLVQIRDSGEVSMFDYESVKNLALKWGLRETYHWMLANYGLYCKGVFCNFIASEATPTYLN